MAIFYKQNPRTFDKYQLVLIAYTYVVAFKKMWDTIMISADTHTDIPFIFDEQMKYLKRRNPEIVWYLPESNKATFKRPDHGEA